MRKILSLLLAAALLLLALAGCSQAQEEEPLPESIEINFFYNEPCGACHDQINDFYDMFNTQLEDVKDKYPYDLQAYNVFQASASDKMYTVLEGLGYPEELISSLTYPILTINGRPTWGPTPSRSRCGRRSSPPGRTCSKTAAACTTPWRSAPWPSSWRTIPWKRVAPRWSTSTG